MKTSAAILALALGCATPRPEPSPPKPFTKTCWIKAKPARPHARPIRVRYGNDQNDLLCFDGAGSAALASYLERELDWHQDLELRCPEALLKPETDPREGR